MDHRFMIFLSAALVLALVPGPGILYVLARTLAGGRREGISSTLGTAVGGMVHVVAAAFGVSAILARSAVAFHTVKYMGAAYLVYVGLRTMFARDVEQAAAAATESAGPARGSVGHGRAFGQGIVTEVLNPKMALFFLSFIPQFVDTSRPFVFTQFISLGAISVALNSLSDLTVVLLAGWLGPRLMASAQRRRQQRIASGGVMVALGAYAAVADGPTSRP
ncbi:LysE family translocator [Pendulispora albinea]|uniref:LysE family translocator n=1 Tax=Pendulispora albinea TaxID=2741071 RepID=A0ABZ2M162_9BACT